MASPSLSSPHPTLLLLSFGSTHSSVLSVLCRSTRCLSVSASSPVLPSLCAPSFFSLIAPLAFLSHPSSLSPRLAPISKCCSGHCSGSTASRSRLAVEEHHTRQAQTHTWANKWAPFSCSNFHCVWFATCVCLYLLQIPELICARSTGSITRTGLTSYASQHRALRDKPPCSQHGRAAPKFNTNREELLSYLPVIQVAAASRRRWVISSSTGPELGRNPES